MSGRPLAVSHLEMVLALTESFAANSAWVRCLISRSHSIALAQIYSYFSYNLEGNKEKNQSAEYYTHGRDGHADTVSIMLFEFFHLGIAVKSLIVGARSHVFVTASTFYFPFSCPVAYTSV